VAGRRNVVYSIAYVLAALTSGWLLTHLPFTLGYQVVFGIGTAGAGLSCLNLFFIRPQPPALPPVRTAPPSSTAGGGQPTFLRAWRASLRTDIWRTPFAAVLLVMLGLHLTQYLPSPLFSLYTVNVMHLTDQNIGIGTGLYYTCCLIGSSQVHRFDRPLGPRILTALGFMMMSFYPFLMGLSHSATGYYVISIIGGFGWALVGSAYANYVLKGIPEHDRPAYLAWYNIILNASILAGSLLGPAIAQSTGLAAALVLIGACRFLAGLAILKWGQPQGLQLDPSGQG
jgi:MFS family permease